MRMRSIGFGVAVLLFTCVVGGEAQEIPAPGAGDPTRVRVTGRVVDAETSAPLAASMVVLEPLASGAVPGVVSGRSGGSAFLSRGWTAMTDRHGQYGFEGVGLGRYRLRVARIGYQPRSIEIELRRTEPVNLSVALTIHAIPLEPIATVAPPPAPFGMEQSRADEIEFGRVAAVRFRQSQYLSTDVRTITNTDVVEAITLGETDVLRAVQRLPGVTTRDDYSALPWVRGAPFDHTRVYFDGMPLFNPVNGFGVLSAVPPEVLGGVFYEPGVRSASHGEGSAALISMSSRPAGGPDVRGYGELSLASARLSMDRRIGERSGVMFGFRRSYADALASLVSSIANDPDIELPYSFTNVVARVDHQLDDQRALYVSGLWERDRLRGDIPDVTSGNRGAWGNLLGQVTLSVPAFGLVSRHSIGATRYRSTVRPRSPTNTNFSAPTADTETSSLRYYALRGEFEPGGASVAPSPWRFGYEFTLRDAAFGGPTPHPWPDAFTGRRDSTSIATRLGMGTLWGEKRWVPAQRVTVEIGARVDVGESVQNGGVVRVSPHITTRFDLTPRLSTSIGVGRTYQYVQMLSGSGIEVADGLRSSAVWLLADRETPALRADAGQMGFEWWLSNRWLTGMTLHARRFAGYTLFDPTPGPAAPLRQDTLFVAGTGWTRGVELSLRRLIGRWTTSASYGYNVSTIEAAGLRFDSGADRRHVLALSTMFRLGRAVRLGTAYQYSSGFPFTRREDVAGLGSPNAVRAPAYTNLDLLFDFQHNYRAWSIGFFLQVRNLLNHDNVSEYQWTDSQCLAGELGSILTPPRCDHFQDGLPILPVFGFRIGF